MAYGDIGFDFSKWLGIAMLGYSFVFGRYRENRKIKKQAYLRQYGENY